MKTVGAFFKLIRWPNLFFIAFTQVLFHFCIVLPSAFGSYYSFPLQLNQHLFWLLCAASVFIAGSGYIINDYFDINIDQVNKPGKMIVDRAVSRRQAILWHWIISIIGFMLSAYVSYRLRNPFIIIGNTACIGLLWVYSTTYKRQLLIGNVLISLMTAWVILVMLVAELPGWWNGKLVEVIEKATAARLSRIALLYASFAFVISLVREVVKDIQDMEGDRKENCRTMPLVWGVTASKVFAGTWLFVLIALLFITQVYVLQFGWWWAAAYILFLVMAPLVMAVRNLFKATTTHQFGTLSRFIKWIMLTGILSMIFFFFYTR